MNKGKEIVMERENGEEIYAKDSMKLEGVRVKSVLVVWVSCKVYFSRSTISLTVLFVKSISLL